jgi:hypothetical protein
VGKKKPNRNRQARRPDGPLLVTWQGEQYQVADKIGDMAMMRFAKVAMSGADSDSITGLAAMYDLLEECLTPRDWARFEAHALRSKATSDQMMELVKETYQALSGRPTVRPSDSSDGQPATVESSEAGSSSPVTRVLDSIPEGRPDLKLAVWEAAQGQQAV